MPNAWFNLLPSPLRLRLQEGQELRKIISNIGWLSSDTIIRMGLGLVVGVWVARYLGPPQYGLLSFSMAFVGLFIPLADLGLHQIVIRELVKTEAAKDQILGTAIVLRMVGSGLILILAIAGIVLIRPDAHLSQQIVIILAVANLFTGFEVIDYWFQAQVAAKYSVWARNIGYSVSAIIRVWLIISEAPLIAFVWAIALETLLVNLARVTIFYLRGNSFRGWRPNLRWAKGLLKDSWPMLLAGLAVVVYMKIDQVMLAQMIGEREVGLYAAAVRISEIWYFLPMAIVGSVFPSIVRLRSSNPEWYYQRLQNLFNLMTGLSSLTSLVITFTASIIITLLFGSDFSESGPILALHIWASIFVFLGVAQSPWTVAENLTKLSLYRILAGAVINVGLNLLLIPTLAGMGAAITTIISYAFSAFILNAVHSKTRPIFLQQARSFLLIRSFRSLMIRL